MIMSDFFKGKKILITGHTGFKGSWLSRILYNFDADVSGYSILPSTKPSLFHSIDIEKKINSVIGDIRDLKTLMQLFEDFQPEIVIHLAAQPIVRDSYKDPVCTYETNVMGTVNVLECIRLNSCVKSFLNVTTDKVYKNNEWVWGYRENEPLVGDDPYSNSKSCSELITHSYKNSFFKDTHTAISTARAGNVIGGGDFSNHRIIPDCVRAAENKKEIVIRNPNSIRPYQHVLEALSVYLTIVQKQYEDKMYADSYNIGPDECDCISTKDLVKLFCDKWDEDLKWNHYLTEGPHEANYLKLDCSKVKNTFDWKPKWHIGEAVEKTVELYKLFLAKGNIEECMDRQIEEYFNK